MSRAVLTLLTALCVGCGFAGNSPPKLVSVNGVAYHPWWGFQDFTGALEAVPGEPFTITLEVRDREGDEVRVWWPSAVPGLTADPSALEVVWDVPEDPADDAGFYVVLEDLHPRSPRSSGYEIPITWFGRWETGGDSAWETDPGGRHSGLTDTDTAGGLTETDMGETDSGLTDTDTAGGLTETDVGDSDSAGLLTETDTDDILTDTDPTSDTQP